MRRLTPTAAKRAVVVVARRRRTTGGATTADLSPASASGYTAATLDDSSVRKRPWENELIKSCAARKQVRVSLDSVLDVSTGERPWRSSFATANPDISAGPEPDFGRRACHSYVSDAERRKTTEGQLQSAQYLHRELPVRLAHAVTALDKMKDTGLTATLPVARVREDYLESFRELQESPRPHELDQLAAFTETVRRAQERGSDTVLRMACGLQDLMRGGDGGEETLERIQEFLDEFYQNRVAMRFLCGHYLALSSPQRDGFVGLVQRGVSLAEIAQGAAIEAATICCHALGACPEIRMRVDPAGDGLVAAVPEYVHYVVLELLKNAMRATMQAHGAGKAVGGEGEGGAGAGMDVSGEESARVQERDETEAGSGGTHNAGDGDAPIVFADVPEVVISVRAHGDDDVVLLVVDQGGGIPAEATDKVWSYLYTTAGEAVKTSYLANGGNSPSKPPPLAGLGYGLPLSRLYARNFGGELKLKRSASGENAIKKRKEDIEKYKDDCSRGGAIGAAPGHDGVGKPFNSGAGASARDFSREGADKRYYGLHIDVPKKELAAELARLVQEDGSLLQEEGKPLPLCSTEAAPGYRGRTKGKGLFGLTKEGSLVMGVHKSNKPNACVSGGTIPVTTKEPPYKSYRGLS
eukprot:g13879.t1